MRFGRCGGGVVGDGVVGVGTPSLTGQLMSKGVEIVRTPCVLLRAKGRLDEAGSSTKGCWMVPF